MASLGDLMVRVGASIDGYTAAMDQVVSKAATTADQVEKRFEKFETVGAAMAKIGVGLTAGLTVPIVGIGTAALTAAGDMEQAQIGFTTLLKSGDAASAMLANLRDFAAKTPFQFTELVTASQRLMAMGFAANEVIPTLRSVGDAVSALGAGPEMMNRIVLALGQMRNSAKLSAADMKQLTEAGISGWRYLSEATGIAMTDIQDKAKDVLTGAQAAQIVMQGMARDFAGGMEAQSRSMVGMWSNVKDAVGFALADIGRLMLPTAKTILEQFVLPTVDGLKSLAAWFGTLPEPIKMGAVALAGLLAAAGPITLAIGALGMAIPAVTAGLTAIAGVLGVAVAPMLAAAAGIAGITVVLVALGTWVAANWEPIKATVLQAWDGLGELWGAIWNPIAGFLVGVWQSIAGAASAIWTPIAEFFGKLWAPVAPYFMAVWNGIGSALSAIWNGIKSAAQSVWNGIIGAIGDFLKWAEKIPGVNKLFNLSEAWKSAEQLAAKTKTATAEVKAHSTAHKAITPVVKASTAEVEKHGKAHKDAEPHVRKMSQAQADHIVKLAGLRRGLDEATDELMLLDAEIRSGRGPLELFARAVDQVKVSLSALMPDFETFSRVMDAVGRQASTTADSFGDAMRRLRVTSTTELKATADSAASDYERISESGIATKGEIEQAWRAMAEAQIAYRESIGEDTSELKAALDGQVSVHKSHGQQVKTIWGQIGDDISRAFDQASLRLSDAMRDLFTGEFSFSKVGDAFKELGLNIVSAFLDVGAKAITDFIAIHLGKLLSAIPGVGKALGGIFGSAGGIGGAVGGSSGSGGIPGAIGGSTGGSGGAIGSAVGGGASNLAGWISAGAGIATAVSSIIGNFQAAKQETTLNAIEESTRYSKIYDLLMVTMALEHWPYIRGIHDFLWNQGITTWAEGIAETQELKMYVRDLIFKMADLLQFTLTIRDHAVATYELLRGGLSMPNISLASPMATVSGVAAGGMVINIDLRGSTISDDAVAERLAQRITDRIRSVTR